MIPSRKPKSCIFHKWSRLGLKLWPNALNILFNTFQHCWTMFQSGMAKRTEHILPSVRSVYVLNACWTKIWLCSNFFQHHSTSFNMLNEMLKAFGQGFKCKILTLEKFPSYINSITNLKTIDLRYSFEKNQYPIPVTSVSYKFLISITRFKVINCDKKKFEFTHKKN